MSKLVKTHVCFKDRLYLKTVARWIKNSPKSQAKSEHQTVASWIENQSKSQTKSEHKTVARWIATQPKIHSPPHPPLYSKSINSSLPFTKSEHQTVARWIENSHKSYTPKSWYVFKTVVYDNMLISTFYTIFW